MKKLFKEPDVGRENCLNFLKQIISDGTATTVNCGWGMKKLSCKSYEVRDLIRLMQANQVPINEIILNSLIQQLLFEDKRNEAQSVMDIDFPNNGLTIDDVTLRTMKRADRLASMGHTTEMTKLLKEHGKEYTMKYLLDLITRGCADAWNCGWGMKKLCNTSNEARVLMKLMKRHNLPINEIILNTLIQQLLFEDNKKAGKELLFCFFSFFFFFFLFFFKLFLQLTTCSFCFSFSLSIVLIIK